MDLLAYCRRPMASVSQLARLFKALAEKDLTSAHDVAAEIASGEERLGHHSAAMMLRGSLSPNQPKFSKRSDAPVGVAQSLLLHEALTPLMADTPLAEVRLRPKARAVVEDLRLEWKHRATLEAAHLRRRSRLLFHGPPGCGKSLTAAAFADALGLPSYVVRFDAVVGSYLGQTAVHLRELFRFAETNPCVLLFDEVDALGKQRGDPLDVGELHRIVITLMQELEHANPAGYVAATSNLPEQLDAALWRRFDLILEFPRPDFRELERFSAARAKALGVGLTSGLRAGLRGAASFADGEKLIQGEARRSLLVNMKRS